MEGHLLAPIVLLPLAGAAFNGLFGKKLPRGFVGFVACATVFASFVFAVAAWADLRAASGETAFAQVLWHWIGSGAFHIDFALRFDRLSAVMVLVVTGVGFLIHVFSLGYMRDDPGYYRYFAYLNLFMFSMLSLVLGANIVVMFLGWEGVGLCSYLLIGFWFDDDAKAQAGQKAFVVNRVGDFGFLVGLFLLLYAGAGNVDFGHLAELFANPSTAPIRNPAVITAICLALFVGATGKSAQIPLYVWLPDAMAGPTPVSALIHAATMVTAGVYMVTRLNFLYSLSPVAMATVATVGAATAFVAATIGVAQRDIKKVLAYSTVSQLGYMFLAAGVGAYTAAIFHLMTHAFFKALLFLGSGAVIHALHGEQDIFRMGNLRKLLPVTHWTFLAATLAISGVPLFSGFFSKEAILHGAAGFGLSADPGVLRAWGIEPARVEALASWFQVLAVVGLLAAVLTAFYMFRLYFMTFWGQWRGDEHTWEHPHRPDWTMKLPLSVLAVLAVVGGFIPVEHWLEPVVERPAAWFHAGEHHGALASMLMPLSLLAAALGIATAWALYAGPMRQVPARIATSLRPVYSLVFHKYYVDEIYDLVIVRPLRAFAQGLFRVVDRVFIDTIGVHIGPWVARATGGILRYLQNGDVQRYAAVMTLGAAIALYLLAS